ncbi:MAG: hypothetical protein AB7U81_05055 [Thiohalomonadaceae bacterium]
MIILLSPNLSDERFSRLAQTWNDEVFVRVELSGTFSEEELARLAAQAIALKPDDFADVVLELIAACPEATPEVLRKIMRHGDDGAREAVCQRADLDGELRVLCGLAQMQPA